METTEKLNGIDTMVKSCMETAKTAHNKNMHICMYIVLNKEKKIKYKKIKNLMKNF